MEDENGNHFTASALYVQICKNRDRYLKLIDDYIDESSKVIDINKKKEKAS